MKETGQVQASTSPQFIFIHQGVKLKYKYHKYITLIIIIIRSCHHYHLHKHNKIITLKLPNTAALTQKCALICPKTALLV